MLRAHLRPVLIMLAVVVVAAGCGSSGDGEDEAEPVPEPTTTTTTTTITTTTTTTAAPAGDDEVPAPTEIEALVLSWLNGEPVTAADLETYFDPSFRAEIGHEELGALIEPLVADGPWQKVAERGRVLGAAEVVLGGSTQRLALQYSQGPDDLVTGLRLLPDLGGDGDPADEADLALIVSAATGDQGGGAAVLTVRDGVERIAVAGPADDSGRPIEPSTPFRVGSITKPFLATMVLQLVDEGSVDLDEPIGTYLSDTPVGATVTVRQLLSHRSGVPNYTEQASFLTDVQADPDRAFTPVEVLGYAADAAAADAGGPFSYSNTNYILLGLLVEAIDGTDIASALDRRIVEPLGLEATRLDDGGPHQASLAVGWAATGEDGDPDDSYRALATGAWAAGALISNLADLSTFLDALFGGQLVSPESLVAMTDTDGEYGLGLARFDIGVDQPPWLGHDGSINGYHAVFAVEPATGDRLVVLTNDDRLLATELAGRLAITG